MDNIPFLVEIGPEESRESIEQRKRIDDFARRYPDGYDMTFEPIVPQKPLTHIIPYYVVEAIWKQAILDKARIRGYSEENIAKMQQMLEPPVEPVLISIEEQE